MRATEGLDGAENERWCMAGLPRRGSSESMKDTKMEGQSPLLELGSTNKISYMKFICSIKRVEPVQTYQVGQEFPVEMRSQALLLQVLNDLVWAERKSPALESIDESQIDPHALYEVMLRTHSSEKKGDRKNYYNTQFEILSIYPNVCSINN